MKEFLTLSFEKHRGKIIGLFCGLLLGIFILSLGFWRSLLLAICIAVGYWIGKMYDKEENFLASLIAILPENIRNKIQ
jgi:uncharacterized membrane protein